MTTITSFEHADKSEVFTSDVMSLIRAIKTGDQKATLHGPSDVDHFGLTMLSNVCNNAPFPHQVELVIVMIEAKFDVNHVNLLKQTPIYFACKYGNVALVQVLLEHGALPHIKTTNGDLPSDVCLFNLRNVLHAPFNDVQKARLYQCCLTLLGTEDDRVLSLKCEKPYRPD